MKKNPMQGALISIIVPVYQTKIEYLQECIESIVHQTYPYLDIVLVSDGAAKECVDCCKEYADRYPFVRVVEQDNQGVSAARNTGMNQALGEWIMFVDSDDVISLDTCKKLAAGIRSEETDVVISRFFLWDEKGIRKTPGYEHNKILHTERDKEELRTAIFRDYRSKYHYIEGPVAKIYRKKILQEYKIRFRTELTVGEDGAFNYEVYSLAREIVYIKIPTYYYRIHQASVMHKFDVGYIRKYENYLRVLTELFDRFHDRNRDDLYFFTVRVTEKIVRNYILNSNNPNTWKTSRRELWEFVSSEPYRTYIRSADISRLNLKRRLLVVLIRYKQYWLIRLLESI